MKEATRMDEKTERGDADIVAEMTVLSRQTFPIFRGPGTIGQMIDARLQEMGPHDIAELTVSFPQE